MINFFIRKRSLALACAAFLMLILFSALTAPTFAADPPPATPGNSLGPPPRSNINSIDDVFGRIKDLFNIFFWLLVVLAAIFIIYAAFIYLTASGEPEKIKKANRMVTYAVVAVVVATLARAIPAVVCNVITTNTSCEVNPETGIPEPRAPR